MQPNLVYVGTYTRAGQSAGIYVFRRDPESGTLTQVHVIPDRDPSFLALDGDARFARPLPLCAPERGRGWVCPRSR